MTRWGEHWTAWPVRSRIHTEQSMASRDSSEHGAGALADTLPPDRSRDRLARVDTAPAEIARLERGDHVGRYVIVSPLGEGGMGVVYEAHDPELDRRVVIKLIRTSRTGERDGVASARLLREGQALARLSHPNVVTVHDVGHLGDDIFVAMEHLPGVDLVQWLGETRRSADEIVAVFVQAAHGLAAAHRAGLVHRDMKPGNVVATRDGRIKVVDFGLAALDTESGAIAPSSSMSRGVVVALRSPLTQVGAWIGTPCYMAPEQYEGGGSRRADQFSFCVAMYEALHGRLPFAGETFPEYAANVISGAVLVPVRADVSPAIDAAIRRGLSTAPGARWPSMNALIGALTAASSARRRRVLIAVAGVVVVGAVGAAGVLAIVRSGSSASVSPCSDSARHLVGRWDVDRAAALRAAFIATGLPYAPSAASRTVASLDRWTDVWVAKRTSVCRATRVHGEQSEALLDARMRCLDRQLDEVAELAGVLTIADRAAIPRAVEATAQLPSLAPCDHADSLLAAVSPPADPTLRAQVETLRRDMVRARGLSNAGRFPVARDLAVSIAARALAVDYPPFQAEALALRGHLEFWVGDLAAARVTLERAADLAATTHQDRLVGEVLIDLVSVLAADGRAAEALGVAAAARAATLRADSPALASKLLMEVGRALATAGDLPAARGKLEEAVTAIERTHGPESIEITSAVLALGGVLERMGQVAGARAQYERAVAIGSARFGADSPMVAIPRANLCYLDAEAGRLREARACQTEVLTVLEAAVGAAHPKVAWALNDAALTDLALGDRAAAKAGFERSLAIWEAASGPDHPDLAWPLVNLGGLTDGDPAGREALCRRALAIIEKSMGTDHIERADPLACVGIALADRAPAQAIEALQGAMAIWATSPSSPASMAAAYFALARARLATGNRRAALVAARRAEELAAAASQDPIAALVLGKVRTWLARHGGRP